MQIDVKMDNAYSIEDVRKLLQVVSDGSKLFSRLYVLLEELSANNISMDLIFRAQRSNILLTRQRTNAINSSGNSVPDETAIYYINSTFRGDVKKLLLISSELEKAING